MAFDPTINTQTVYAGSFKHLRTRRGLDTGKTVTLDVAKFTSGTHYPRGYIPAGVVLGKVTASSKFGPYGEAATEDQTITIDATGGTFTITFRGGTTAAIAYNATAAQVQAALEALAEIDAGDVVVTGGPGATAAFHVKFQGQYAGTNVAAMTTGAGSLTGGASTATVATATGGGSSASDGTEVAKGVLLDRVPILTSLNQLTAPSLVVAAMMTEGDFVEANMPIASGTAGGIDDAGKAQLGPLFTWS